MSIFLKGVCTGVGITVGVALICIAIKRFIDKIHYVDDFSDIEDDWDDEDFEMYCKLEEELFGDEESVDAEPANNKITPSKLSYDDVFGPISPADWDDGK